VSGGASGTITNVGKASASTADPDADDNRATASTTVNPSADVRVTKTGPASADAGTNVTYTITVFNDGPSMASNVVVIDSIPAGTAFVSASGGGVHSGGEVSWPTVASLAPGANQAFTVTVGVPADASGSITNVGKASSSTADPDPDDNRAPASTTVTHSADVEVVSVTDSPDPIIAGLGTLLTYAITVRNNGPSDAVGIEVSDVLPADVTFVSATGGGLDSGGTVTWSSLALTAGESVVLGLTITVDAGRELGLMTNGATATATTPDPTPANNSAETTTTIVSLEPEASADRLESAAASTRPPTPARP
jgi:uncharacterized repeat protein (TIGR01451 family)